MPKKANKVKEMPYMDAVDTARRRAQSVRIYGVPLTGVTPENEYSVAIAYWGGENVGNTDRILHLKVSDILASGAEPNLEFDDGNEVQWFDIERSATVIEERYVAHSVASLIAGTGHNPQQSSIFDQGSFFGNPFFGVPEIPVVATPIVPVGPTPIVPVGPTPIVPVGPTPIVPVGPTPVIPI